MTDHSSRASRRPTWRWALPILAALGLTMGLLALFVLVIPRPSSMLAQQWRQEAASVPDDDVLPRLRELAEFDNAGIEVLVEALDSDREIVARSARVVLYEQLDSWQVLPAQTATPKIIGLAAALAQRVPGFGVSARQVAADLATQILLWPINDKEVETHQMIADCEAILRAADAAGPVARLSGRPTSANVDPAAGAASQTALWPVDELPDAVVEAPALPNSDRRAVLELPTTQLSGRIERDSDDAPQRLPTLASEPLPPATSGVGTANLRAELLTDRPVAELIARLDELEHVAVMQLLHAGNPQVSTSAHNELAQRGFTEQQIQVARGMTDPDPRVRRELALALPRLAGINARPWLFWLSRDRDPDVRLEAIAILATSQDPEVRKQVRQLLEDESDPRIVERAEAAGLRR